MPSVNKKPAKDTSNSRMSGNMKSEQVSKSKYETSKTGTQSPPPLDYSGQNSSRQKEGQLGQSQDSARGGDSRLS